MAHCSLVQDIEAETGRTVTIETASTVENLAKCHSQEQSPLFKLPAELRNVIFMYATLPYDDPDQPYEETKRYYRPGQHARHIVCTALLRTCRRAWLETNGLAMQRMVHCFWFIEPEHRPGHVKSRALQEKFRLDDFILNLTINSRKDLKHVQLFAENVWLEEQAFRQIISALLGHYGRCPEILTITILHTASLHWNINNPLRFRHRWLQDLLQWPALPRLCEVRLELEAPEHGDEAPRIMQKLREKYQIVQRADHFGDLATVELQESPPEWKWCVRNDAAESHFRVLTLVWKVSSMSSMSETVSSKPVVDEDFVDLTHRMGSELPVLTIGNPDQLSSGFLDSGAITKASTNDHRKHLLEGTVQEYLDRWQREGSLLKFAQTVPQC